MRHEDLKGRRYIRLVRCSSKASADTSPNEQLAVLKSFGDEHGMIHVDDVVLEGVRGTRHVTRTDIALLVQRKKQRNDFDTVLVQDSHRFGRGGVLHASKLKYDLKSVGIRLISATEPLPEGDLGDAVDSFNHMASHEYVKKMSFNVVRGQRTALETGRRSHCGKPPYGIDKLYLTEEGKPLHIVRLLQDGRQQRLDPKNPSIVLGEFPSNRGRKGNHHYRKQKNERVVLIPGAPEAVKIVRQIFKRRHIDRWSIRPIIRELHQQGWRGPTGNGITKCFVDRILTNPIYVGHAIANRASMALLRDWKGSTEGCECGVRSDCHPR